MYLPRISESLYSIHLVPAGTKYWTYLVRQRYTHTRSRPPSACPLPPSRRSCYPGLENSIWNPEPQRFLRFGCTSELASGTHYWRCCQSLWASECYLYTTCQTHILYLGSRRCYREQTAVERWRFVPVGKVLGLFRPSLHANECRQGDACQ